MMQASNVLRVGKGVYTYYIMSIFFLTTYKIRNMRQFINENRLTTDNCALLTKELQNKSMNDYYLTNTFSTSSCKDEGLKDFMISNPNLTYRDGYGFASACVIDEDSELRYNSKLTNFREKEQLCTRWYQAGPNVGKGGLIAPVESRLKLGEDTSPIKECDIVSEKQFPVFVPMIGCLRENVQNPENIILPFERGGAPTRDFVLKDEFLEKCGFVNDGKMWRRQEGRA
jgi:hypothetical protein